MATTNHLGITLVEQSQAQKEVTVNQAFTRIDAVLNNGAKSRSVNTPPGSPATGDLYIVGGSPMGAWAGEAGTLAYFDQIWRFIVPNEGMTIWVNDEDLIYSYNGTAWIALSSAGTVTSVSVTTANGISGTVATATTTPAISLILGSITPSSVAASGTVSGSNLSGSNTGDQTITLTGDVTGSGPGSFAAAIAANAVSNAKFRQSAASTLVGNATGGTANVADVTLGSNLAFASGSLTLGAAVLLDSSTHTLTNKTFNAQGTGNNLSNIATNMFASNVVDNDATLSAASSTRLPTQQAVKSYMDNNLTGLSWKNAVRVATTGNGTLATAYQNGSVIDGITLSTGNRILIKNQTSGSDNGIYIVNASGAPTRSTDAATGTELVSATVFVEAGTVNADTQWTCTNDSVTLGTSSLVFAQVSGAGTYSAGTGMQLLGNQFAIDGTVATLTGTQTLTNKNIAATQLTGSLQAGQFPALTGNVTTTAGSLATTIGTGVVTNAMLAGSIAASNLVGTDIATVGTITSGTWHGTKIGLAYGGTNGDLSATGGASQVLKQTSSGGAITVAQLGFADISGTAAAAQGGTGKTSYSDGQLLIGDSSTGGLDLATLTAGSNITITNGHGSITIAASGGGGSPGGSSGQVQFNNSSAFGGAAGLTYQSGASPNLTMQAQNAAHVPLVVKGATSQTADLLDVQNSSGAALFSFDNHGRPIALADGTTTIAAGAGAGTGPTISITGNDVAGVITLTTGTSPTANSIIATISFANAYGAAPKAVFVNGLGSSSVVSSAQHSAALSTTSWQLYQGSSGGLTASTAYQWQYLVIG